MKRGHEVCISEAMRRAMRERGNEACNEAMRRGNAASNERERDAVTYFSEKERYQKMVEKNPTLDELRKRLDLDLD